MPTFIADVLFGGMFGITTGIWIGMLINARRRRRLLTTLTEKENNDRI